MILLPGQKPGQGSADLLQRFTFLRDTDGRGVHVGIQSRLGGIARPFPKASNTSSRGTIFLRSIRPISLTLKPHRSATACCDNFRFSRIVFRLCASIRHSLRVSSRKYSCCFTAVSSCTLFAISLTGENSVHHQFVWGTLPFEKREAVFLQIIVNYGNKTTLSAVKYRGLRAGTGSSHQKRKRSTINVNRFLFWWAQTDSNR